MTSEFGENTEFFSYNTHVSISMSPASCEIKIFCNAQNVNLKGADLEHLGDLLEDVEGEDGVGPLIHSAFFPTLLYEGWSGESNAGTKAVCYHILDCTQYVKNSGPIQQKQ